jgi:trehalose 6-phosphate synthase/phosphatase
MSERAASGPVAAPALSPPRIIIASNRLPITLRACADGAARVEPAHGGLARALAPLVERSGGVWIGWPGVASEEVDGEALAAALAAWPGLRGVPLSRAEVEGYYAGFSNSVLWPLFHGLASRCEFGGGGWEAYERVNARFAEVIAGELAEASAVVWLHDFHLLRVAEHLRARGVSARLGFFLHTPFPSLDDLVKLPWREALLRALLAHDVVGVQSARDLRRLLTCVEKLAPDVSVSMRGDCEASIAVHCHDLVVGVFPIGIDTESFRRARDEAHAASEAAALRASAGERTILLGVDRLDYTKGLPERLAAFERALERHPELVGRVVYVQVVVPSREQVPAYARLRREVERGVGRISGRYATADWAPIRYLYRAIAPDALLALYREADIALVTPLADGMNLVAKEYCAAKVDRPGVLVLSEMAGAACQLRSGALLVNPYDQEAIAEAIWRAYTMSPGERRARMRRLRDIVLGSDVHWWGDAFISSLLRDEPVPAAAAEVLPTIRL